MTSQRETASTGSSLHGGFDNSAPLHMPAAAPYSISEFTGAASASGVHCGPGHFLVHNEFDLHSSHQQEVQLTAARVLRNRLHGLDLAVIPNQGVSSNQSLEHAMLQSRGVPLDDVEQAAEQLHFQLIMRDDALGYALFEGQQCLCENGPLLQELAGYVFGTGNAPPILFMVAQESGTPLLCNLMGRDCTAVPPEAVRRHDTVLLFVDGNNHCELVANKSGRPLSDVLKQLQMAPDDPRGGSSVEWGVHVALAARPFEIRITGKEAAYRWKLGLQAGLVSSSVDQNLGPVVTAQAMARTQYLVDEFLTKLERNGAVHHSLEALSDGGEMHWLNVLLHGGLQLGGVRVRADRIISLTLKASVGCGIVVEYDHPWSRETQTPQQSRKTLEEYSDELDLYDAFRFALRNCQEKQPGDLIAFAAFLLDLRKFGGGMRFHQFANLFSEARQAYLRSASTRDRQVDAEAVERAITIVNANLPHPRPKTASKNRKETVARHRATGEETPPRRRQPLALSGKPREWSSRMTVFDSLDLDQNSWQPSRPESTPEAHTADTNNFIYEGSGTPAIADTDAFSYRDPGAPPPRPATPDPSQSRRTSVRNSKEIAARRIVDDQNATAADYDFAHNEAKRLGTTLKDLLKADRTPMDEQKLRVIARGIRTRIAHRVAGKKVPPWPRRLREPESM